MSLLRVENAFLLIASCKLYYDFSSWFGIRFDVEDEMAFTADACVVAVVLPIELAELNRFDVTDFANGLLFSLSFFDTVGVRVPAVAAAAKDVLNVVSGVMEEIPMFARGL